MEIMTDSQENQTLGDLGSYIKTVTDQEIKVLLLKLKNEARKEDVSWEQIKQILIKIGSKDIGTLRDIITLLI